MSKKTHNPFTLIKLSRITTVCFDKSALCDGELVVNKLVILDANNTESQVSQIIANVINAVNEQNPLLTALKKQYDFEQSSVVKAVLPYNQKKHCFGASFTGGKTFVVGLATHMALKNKTNIVKKCEEFIGQDVYVLGRGIGEITDGSYDDEMDAVALIVIKENIKESIPSSIKWLNENNINTILISNEEAKKALSIASEAGIKDANKYVSLKDTFDEQVKISSKQFNVFGDASPRQRKIIIRSLKRAGEKVLLVDQSFDNVSETLERSKTFTSNLQRVGLLFIAKAMFAVLLSLIFAFGALSKTFDFPVGLYRFFIFSGIVDIAASVLLMLDNSKNENKDRFWVKILKISLPGSLLMFISAVVMFVLFAAQQNGSLSLGIYNNQVASAMTAISSAVLGAAILFNICGPITKYRRLVLSLVGLLTVLLLSLAAVVSYATQKVDVLFGIPFMEMNGPAYLLTAGITILLAGLYFTLYTIFRKDEHNEN